MKLPVISAAATLLLVGATGCRRSPPPKPLAELTPAERAGHIVYRQHCAVCHRDRDSRPLRGPSLAGIYKRQYLPSGAPANDDRVTNTILHGRGNMPPQGNDLDNDDLENLLAYLHTL